MTVREIIKVCDLYAQGINELSKLTSQEGYSKELSELLNAMLKSKEHGFNYTHDWIKQYVLNTSQINDNGKELLYVAQTTAKRIKKDVISKACEWLRTHLFDNTDADNDPIVESVANLTKDEFIKDFRNYMKYGKQN